MRGSTMLFKQLKSTDKLSFSVAETEYLSGLSRTNIYRLIAMGKLKTVKVGGRRLIPAQALRELLAP